MSDDEEIFQDPVEPTGDEELQEQGELPTPTSMVATHMHTTAMVDQRAQAGQIFDYLYGSDDPDLAVLNEGTGSTVFLVCTPTPRRRVRVLHTLRHGTKTLLHKNPMEGKTIGLFGGGDDGETPRPICITDTPFKKAEVLVPTKEQTAHCIDTATTIKALDVEKAAAKEVLMKAAPVPAYVVYDGLEETELDAQEVLDRLEYLDGDAPWKEHAENFVRTTFVSNHRQQDKKTWCLSGSELASKNEKMWAKQEFKKAFGVQSGLGTQQPFDVQALTELAMQTAASAAVAAVQQISPGKQATTAGPTETAPTNEFNMSQGELDSHLQFCGLNLGQEDRLPPYLKEIRSKRAQKGHKQVTLRRQIAGASDYPMQEVPICQALLDNIIAGKYVSADSYLTMSNCTSGLSVFGLCVEEDEVLNNNNYEAELLEKATSTTVADWKRVTKQSRVQPTDGRDLVDALKRFCNLIQALFTTTCPLRKPLQSLINILERYRPHVLRSLGKKNMANIMWITQMQAREFFSGCNDETEAFSLMLQSLKAENTNVINASCPKNLWDDGKPKKREVQEEEKKDDGGEAGLQTPKRQKGNKVVNNNPHPLVVKKVGSVMDKYGVRLKQLCELAKINTSQLVGGRMCALNAAGKCKNLKCTFDHGRLGDEDANRYVQMLSPALENEGALANLKKRNTPHVRRKLDADAKDLRDAAITRIKRQMEQLQVSPARKVATKRLKPLKDHWTATPMETVEQIFGVMEAEEVLPSKLGIKETIGKKGLMWPRGPALQHPAMKLLMEYAEKGCPVDCGRDWTVEEIEAALLHGPHKSAKSPEAAAALRAETMQKVKNGYAKIVRYGDIRHKLPRNLKISPCACIPHKSRQFRVILDLSFALQMETHRVPSVNEATTPLSKEASMAQLGSTIKRIVQTMAENYDKSKPFVFSKLDIKDGFWRLCVSEEDAWNFAYVLPSDTPVELDDIQVVVPDALQMGWCESPPFFCTASETARDVIQELWDTGVVLEEHPLEYRMKYMDVAESCPSAPTTLIEVYVDDYIGVTNDISCEKLQRLSRCMLHGIHSIFPPPEVTGHDGEDSIAEKKIDKGEGIWAHEKEILGWIFNGKNYTIQLPPEKCDIIIDNIQKIIRFKRTVPRNLLESMLGKLQHASFGVPGSRGMLSPLQEALTKPKPFIPLTKLLKQCLQSWLPIVKHMKEKPTSIMLLVKTQPEYIGYSDACGIGAGGVWTSGTKGLKPVVWQVEWTEDVKEAFAKGILTINDLELAGLVLEWMALECLLPSLVGVHAAAFCDNTSAVSWSNKLATSTSRAAARLLARLERLLDRTDDSFKVAAAGDVLSAWRAIDAGTTPTTAKTREKYWAAWCRYCSKWNQDPYLQGLEPLETTIILSAFASRVRTGFYGRGNEVKVPSVCDAIAAISTSIKLVGKQVPFKEAEDFTLPIKRMLEGMRRDDAPPVPQLAVPVSVVAEAYRHGEESKCPKEQAVGQLCLIAFFYLLRVGEYTAPRFVTTAGGNKKAATRTKQFRVGDIGLWKNKQHLQKTSDLKEMLSADAATMKISNQKNGRMGQTIHQEATSDPSKSAATALAKRAQHILEHGGNDDTLLCDYFDHEKKKWMSVTPKEMITEVRRCVKVLGLNKAGIDPDLVGVHSLRAGGAMALKLAGESDATIMKMGRWSGLTFTMYIHNQIAHLAHGMSDRMAEDLPFTNIATIA